MRFFLQFSLLAGLALLLGGCGGRASVTENQCMAGDWQTLGYRDGVRGMRSTALLSHQDACGEHGIFPDRHGYMLGWQQGAREFCEPNNGFQVGERGQAYNNVCPEELRADFMTAYRKGRSLFEARSEVSRIERAIYQTRQHLESVESDIVATAAAQFSGTLLPEERVTLLARTKQLADEQAELEMTLVDLEVELEKKLRSLDTLNQSLASATF
jgi:hypothetical protein